MTLDHKTTKRILRQKGFTQKEIAESLGVSPAAVSDWLKGAAQPNHKKVTELASLLDVDADDLMTADPAVSIGQPHSGVVFYFHSTNNAETIIINHGQEPNTILDDNQSEDTDLVGLHLPRELLEKLRSQSGGKAGKMIEDLISRHLDKNGGS